MLDVGHNIEPRPQSNCSARICALAKYHLASHTTWLELSLVDSSEVIGCRTY